MDDWYSGFIAIARVVLQDQPQLLGAERADILTMGEQDIKTNWRKHRQRYMREMKR